MVMACVDGQTESICSQLATLDSFRFVCSRIKLANLLAVVVDPSPTMSVLRYLLPALAVAGTVLGEWPAWSCLMLLLLLRVG